MRDSNNLIDSAAIKVDSVARSKKVANMQEINSELHFLLENWEKLELVTRKSILHLIKADLIMNYQPKND